MTAATDITALARPNEAISADRVDLVKRTICKGATDDELVMFVETANRLKLDPFARQVFAVKRWDRDAGREVMSIQVSIDGFRLVAERTGKYAGQLGPFWTADGKEWLEVWLDRDPPRAAKVGVLRSDFKAPLWGVATWEQYKQTKRDGGLTSMWAKMGPLMLAKCAESLALRRAFPNELSGVYTQEEMQQGATGQDQPEYTPPAEPRAAPPPAAAKRKSANHIPHDGKKASPDQVKLLHVLRGKLGMPKCDGPDACAETYQEWSKTANGQVEKTRWCTYHTQLMAFRDQAGERIRTSKDLSQAQISNLIDRYQEKVAKHEQATREIREQHGDPPPDPATLAAQMASKGIDEQELCGYVGADSLDQLDNGQAIDAMSLIVAWDTELWPQARDNAMGKYGSRE